MNSSETFSHDATHKLDLHLNILTPVADVSTLKLIRPLAGYGLHPPPGGIL